MAILDFLKTEDQKKKTKKPSVKKQAKVLDTKKEEIKLEKSADATISSKKTTTVSKKGISFEFEAIKKPHISEKATFLAEKNQYTFDVPANYNKTEIKKAVEGIYNVDVLSVNMITIPPKKRRLGKTQGWRKKATKAIVKIKEGQKIEIL